MQPLQPSPEMQRASKRLFTLGDLRGFTKGMPDSVNLCMLIGDLSVPIETVTESAPMAGRFPPSTVSLIPDASWLARGIERLKYMADQVRQIRERQT